METGQMNMIQMPIDGTLQTTVTGSSPVQGGEQDGSAFAGILRGMTPQAPAQSTVVAGVVPAKIPSQAEAAVEAIPLVVMDMKPETLVMLVTTQALQSSDKVVAEVVRAEQSEKGVEQKKPEDLIPQEVVMNAALAQSAQTLQIFGRMPESDQNGDVQVDTVTNRELQVAGTAAPIVSDTPVQQIMEAYSRPAATASKAPSPAMPQVVIPVEKSLVRGVVASSVAEPDEEVKSSLVSAPAFQRQVVQTGTPEVAETPHVETASTDVKPVIAATALQLPSAPASPEELQQRPVENVAADTTLQVTTESAASLVAPPVEKQVIRQVLVSTAGQPNEVLKTVVSPPTIQSTAFEIMPASSQEIKRSAETVAGQTARQAQAAQVAIPVEKSIVQQLVSSETKPAEVAKTSVVSAPVIQERTMTAAAPEVAEKLRVETASASLKPVIVSPTEQSAMMPASPQEIVQRPLEASVVAQATRVATPITPALPDAPAVAEVLSVPATSTPALPKISQQQIMEAYSRPFTAVSGASAATVAEKRPVEAVAAAQVAQVEISSSQHLDAAPAVHTDVVVRNTAVAAMQEQGTQKPIPTPLLVVATIPEQPQTVVTTSPVQSAIETGAIPARLILKMNDRRVVVHEEQLQQQAPATKDAKTAANVGNVFSGAVKAVADATTGEESWSGDKPASDRTMSGQAHQILQQQIKTETVAATVPVSGSTSGVAEQVAKQISEHLAKHEIKTGSEQIVIKLSPENLGELKVNLRMENQRLSVEIVTENRMARDAILQNSDTLKESLAKQNIRMDSFDVSSGSNGHDNLAGRSGRNQNDWQEMTSNKQASQWQQGGYNLPKDFIPEKLAYNPHIEYGMLDVHF